MADETPTLSPADTLSAVVSAYLRDVEAGRSPDRDALLRQHPSLAEGLRAFFAARDQLDRLSLPVRLALPADDSRRGYEVLEELGRGGMGEVYRARDRRLGREVAVKVIRQGHDLDPDALARFEREARLLASLNHPNIATIHGLEEVDGRLYLVMELVPGDTLDHVLAAGPLPMPRALDVCRQIALALEAAHARGIIHRDLKPGNVKVTPDGTVKLLDFGLAKTLPSRPLSGSAEATVTFGVTAPGAIVGTPAYMSPEQARGQSVDQRTDVWSFGCILFESLAGRRPFGAPTPMDLLVAILDRPPAWAVLPASTLPRIRKLLERCLSKERDSRPADMAIVRREVEAALDELRQTPTVQPVPAVATVPVVIVPEPAEVVVPEVVVPVVSDPSTTQRLPAEPPPPLPPPPRRRPWALVVTLLLIVGCCGGGYFGAASVVGWVKEWWAGSPFSSTGPSDTIAVLPFVTGDVFSKDGEAFAASVNRELVSAAPKLKVTAHSVSVSHRGDDPKFAATFLKVRWLVTGKIEQGPEKGLVIRAELIDTSSQTTVWQHSYPARSASDEEVASAIAQQVARQLKRDR